MPFFRPLWRESVNVAMHSGAKELVLCHHDPHPTNAMVDTVVADARNDYPRVRAASEGQVIGLRRLGLVNCDPDLQGRYRSFSLQLDLATSRQP